MNILVNAYLKTKHWQLFLCFLLPLIIIFTVFYISFTQQISYLLELESSTRISDNEILSHIIIIANYFKYFFLIIILSSFIISFWNWAITIGLQEKIPDNLKINLTRFNIFFFIPIVYLLLISVLLIYVIDKLPDFITLIESNIATEQFMTEMFFPLFKFVPIFLLLHFLSIFSFLHTIFFTAKTIKLAELKRKLKSDECIGEFFLLWFYHIGVWFIQPRVNKLYDDDLEKQEIKTKKPKI